ncbi:MAG: bi-domain-containing oxidoreductase [Planctomycetota bacterium]|jgi:polar amino acid transport system substrate-binding protein
MLSVVENFKTGRLEIADLPAPAARPGFVLVANRASLISAGTERAAITLARKSLAGKALERPDLVRQVMAKLRRDGLKATLSAVRARLDTPMALGYSSAGVVMEAGEGVSEFAPGDRCACAGAKYATHSEVVCVPRNLCAAIPEGVSFEAASFVTLGAIAMHGVRQAGLSLGERAAVIGCGLVGLLTVQILAAAGVKVFAVDVDKERVELALKLGAAAGAGAKDDNLQPLARQFTDDVGFDAVLVTAASKSSEPVHLAALLARDRARVVIVGDVAMSIRRRPFYEKELTLIMSRSYGPGRYDPNYEERGIEYPVSYVRWGERKNLEEFLDLVASGKVDVESLTTHTFAIAEALSAYDLVLGRRAEPHIGIVLTYPEREAPEREVALSARPATAREGRIGVGFVGAGAFASSVLLPALSKAGDTDPVVICSAGGLSAEHQGRKFGFARATTDFEAVIADDAVNAIIIATRHNLHASQAARALATGKHVFVEKPLALTRDELEEVRGAYENAGRILMVGFNRRFSPHTAAARELFSGLSRPKAINYRVNAGVVPQDSWIQDRAEGGGRILGEVCHFIDLVTFLAGSRPGRVYAVRCGGGAALAEDRDSVVVTLDFKDGSVAAITYAATGDPSVSKERLEVACGGRTAVIEDFRRTVLLADGKRRKVKTARDKGHEAEMRCFLESIRSGRPAIDFADLYAVTLATIAAEESLALGAPVAL